MNNLFTKDMYAEKEKAEIKAAVYCRLSKDDVNYDAESESIQNQRAMLERYCSEQDWEVVAVYQDDGYTGLNMNRPDLQRMLKAIARRQIDVVLTKDLSRLGRDHTDVNYLFEKFFPKNNVRYIAVNDSADTANENNEIVPFKTLVNQMYSADVSKKVHSAYLTKAQDGKFTGCLAPFGYMKSPEDKNFLIVDPETAGIVQLIFSYAKDGRGPNYIRRKLEDKKIPTPTWWNRKRGLRKKVTKFELLDPVKGHYIWDFSTIKNMLKNPVYIGAIASQKQLYKFKVGWIRDKEPHEWLIVENVHEPIVSREDFELIQQKVESRKRPDAFGNYSVFAGLLKCGQCGSSMNIRRANTKSNERIYTCSKYNKFGVAHCSQHRIKYDVIYDIVLEQIRSYAQKALADEQNVIRQLKAQSSGDAQNERFVIEKTIAEDSTRLASMEKLLKKLYDDLVDERISIENFNSILEKTQKEQESLKKRVKHNQERIREQESEQQDTDRWIELIKDYADIKELTGELLNRLIKKIVIHEDMDENVIRQTVEIHFNFMGQPDKYKLVRK